MSDNLQAPCRNCGLQNVRGRDFCEQCGEYISWSPTMQVAAVQARTSPDDAAGDAAEKTAGPVAGDEREARSGLRDDHTHAEGGAGAGEGGVGAEGGGDARQPAGSRSGEIPLRRADADERRRDDDGDAAVTPAPSVAGDGGATPQPPGEDDRRGPLARAADEAGPVESQHAPAPDETRAEDASAPVAGGATGASGKSAKRRGRAALPARRDRRARPPWGRRAPPPPPRPDAAGDADADAHATTPPLDTEAQATPSAHAADAPTISSASAADAPPIPVAPDADDHAPRAPEAGAPTPAYGDVQPPPHAPPDDARDPTAPAPRAGAPPPPPPPPPPQPPAGVTGLADIAGAGGDASIVLSHDPRTVGAAGVPAVDAGSTLSYNATIRNESRLVDNYELSVLGLPEGWSVVTPPTAFLVPLGSGRGESDTTVRIDITPPRHFRSTAGVWTFEIIAMSSTTASVAGRAIAQFEVRPFPAWTVEAVPVVNSGRLKARYRIAVRNDGNGDQRLWLLALDDNGRLRPRFTAGSLILAPGALGVDVLTLRPRLPLPVGRTKEHRVGVDAVDTAPEVDEDALSLKEKLALEAREKGKKQADSLAKGVKVGPKGVSFRAPRVPNPAVIVRKRVQKLTKAFKPDVAMLQRMRSGGEPAGPLTARQVVFRQKPIIPLWFLGLLLLLALIAVAIYLLLPKEVEVPRLIGLESSFVAEKKLREAGLVLSHPVQKRASGRPTGTVLDQSPGEAVEVEEGSAVSVVIAIPDGNAKVDVPSLKGLTSVDADKRLRDADLLLGEAKPDDAGENFVVRSQIPAENLRVPKGTTVRVFLEKPKKKAAKKKDGAGKGGAGAAAAGKGGAAAAGAGQGGKGRGGAPTSIKVPAFKGKKLAAYTKLVKDLGLKVTTSRTLSQRPVNTVLKVEPKVGETAKRGATVKVVASGGPPTLALQIGREVRAYDITGGLPKAAGAYPLGGGSATELDYGPTGQNVVYRAARRIIVSGTAVGDKPRTIYTGPDVLEHPAWAPNGRTLAVIRRKNGDGDLCFGVVSADDPLDPLCLPDDGWDLDGRVSWRPDGKAVLVPGRRASNRSVFGLRMYETERANATAPDMWRGTTATDVGTPGKGVLAAAFSPTGGQVAAVSNLKSDRFEVFVGDAGDLKLEDAKSSDVAACDVAWGPGAKDIAVVQAGAACRATTGSVKQFPADDPDEVKTIVLSGSYPVYRPVK